MRKILRYFGLLATKYSLVFGAGTVLMELILHQFKMKADHLVYLPSMAFWIFAAIITEMTFVRNLNWIPLLPISKRQVILTNFVLRIYTFALSAALALFSVDLLAWLWRTELSPDTFAAIRDFNLDLAHLPAGVLSFLDSLPKLFHPDRKEPLFHAIEILRLSPALGLLNLLGSAFLFAGLAHLQNRRFFAQSIWSKRVFRQFFESVLFVWFFCTFFWSSFGWLALVVVVLSVLPAFTWVQALSPSPEQRRRWYAYALGLAFLQLLILYGIARSATQSLWLHDRMEASVYLGRLAPSLSDRDLVEALRQARNQGVSELASEYRVRFIEPSKGSQGNTPPALDLDRPELGFYGLVKSKTRPEDFDSVVGLFPIESMKPKHVRAILAGLTEVNYRDRSIFSPGYAFLSVPIPSDDVMEMIQSKEFSVARFGLLHTRFYRDPRFIPVIEHELPRYDDELKGKALAALSELAGRPWAGAFETLRGIQPGSPGGLHFYDGHCAEFHPESAAVLDASQLSRLAVCLHEKSVGQDSDTMKALSNAFEWKWPLEAPQTRLVEKIFKLPEPLVYSPLNSSKMRQFEAAAKKRLTSNPSDPEALLFLSTLAFRNKKTGEGLEFLEKLEKLHGAQGASLDPLYSKRYDDLASSLEKVDAIRGLPWAERARVAEPKEVSHLRVLRSLSESLKDYGNALTWGEKVIALDPKEASDYAENAAIEAEWDHDPQALEWLKKMKAAKGDYQENLYSTVADNRRMAKLVESNEFRQLLTH